MADAYKCDRCKNYFEEDELCKDGLGTLMYSLEGENIPIMITPIGKIEHICPSCMVSILEGALKQLKEHVGE
ncbi:MAG: hypothetical protein KAS32_16750 [Candidatus Peribacteraceae bacterium]|nr:hypothetical protein [Candidatus Peribacteraceae bacterium]